MKYYSTAQLSERISETPEGFLICEAVPIARAGTLLYNPEETPITPGDGATSITRTIEDIHDPETIASFEGKPVTMNHPDDFVTPDNWREVAVGVVQNVRPGEGDDADKLLADLLITDRDAIAAVKSKQLREVSCGYEAEYIETGLGTGQQSSIIGNHVALVAAGRCGSECAIFDHAPKIKEKIMGMKEKIMGLFGKALDEAIPDDEAADAKPEVIPDAKPEVKPEVVPDDEAADEDPMAAMSARCDAIEARLAVLEADEAEEEDPAAEEVPALDADTVARAEILAPGIAKTGDVKAEALKTAYATADGKAAIDPLLAGKTMATVDVDMLFVAASELMKGARRKQLQNARISLDSLPSIKAGPMTPEKLNEINAARYNKN